MIRCFDEHKRTPLHFASAMGYTEVADILLKHGADPNQKVCHDFTLNLLLWSYLTFILIGINLNCFKEFVVAECFFYIV